ncbi:zinc finger CCCH domain-containing protein 14 [Neodiprion pinetum]|uniref:zinc finger CCCH domain-containing protein 14 n=1 Tax=Neodiprion pinetum TaxID=441929 RepID=UPI001EDCCC4E|nr:zinc finger CCCH domain-containing protein 14-like [Neodiprion pinetum]
MDIRGIEVTNQLRSAIRAKLLELGVRYDEELPDYILVMVVNKKTRQQMYEDLCLFLEENTLPFVDWLHDQVLKKLQKVTVAKKKSSRDLVPTVIVKQEEERKKKKSCPTPFLEDQTTDTIDKISKVTKLQKKVEKSMKPSVIDQTLHSDVTQDSPNSLKKIASESKLGSSLNVQIIDSSHEQKDGDSPTLIKGTTRVNHDKSIQLFKPFTPVEHVSKSSIEAQIDVKISEISSKNFRKNSVDSVTNKLELTSSVAAKPLEKDENDRASDDDSRKKVKSSVNKPRITSVVTVKNRLEFPMSKNKFENHKNRPSFESRYRQPVRGADRHEFEGSRRSDFSSGRNTRSEDYLRRNIGKNHDFESRNHDSDKIVDIKSRLGNVRDDRSSKSLELKDKSCLNRGVKNVDKLSNSIKDRLGSGNSIKIRESSLNRRKDLLDEQRNAKFGEKERLVSNSNLSVKNRLGPVRSIFKLPDVKRRFNLSNKVLPSSEDEDCLNLRTDDDTDDDTESVAPVGPIKSRIIAVKRTAIENSDRKRPKIMKDGQTVGTVGKELKSDDDDDERDIEDGKIASKVIVTPRPLKPLPPLQRRATQSLLLRAVAEANQSVVTRKNPEPVLMEKITAAKRPIASGMREGQNLSVRLNSSKRLVMEKIQVELTTGESDIDNPEPYVPQPVTDEHMGVVMSLFQRSNDSQKFLVTLNGYNNNVSKEKGASDEDERLEMELDEDDDFILTNESPEEYTESKTAANGFQSTHVESVYSDKDKTQTEEIGENHNDNNAELEESLSRKKRKLSPIVYTRSRSSSPLDAKSSSALQVPVKSLNKHVAADPSKSNTIDKSKEKCRYWPNCTLGIKCTYYHPTILCSAFPACKFGDKCLYKHPKCKFGLSCTKLGCVYTHPPRQCKYHPYCTNPACTYTHPLPQIQHVEGITHRAKFTWRKHE